MKAVVGNLRELFHQHESFRPSILFALIAMMNQAYHGKTIFKPFMIEHGSRANTVITTVPSSSSSATANTDPHMSTGLYCLLTCTQSVIKENYLAQSSMATRTLGDDVLQDSYRIAASFVTELIGVSSIY